MYESALGNLSGDNNSTAVHKVVGVHVLKPPSLPDQVRSRLNGLDPIRQTPNS